MTFGTIIVLQNLLTMTWSSNTKMYTWSAKEEWLDSLCPSRVNLTQPANGQRIAVLSPPRP